MVRIRITEAMNFCRLVDHRINLTCRKKLAGTTLNVPCHPTVSILHYKTFTYDFKGYSTVCQPKYKHANGRFCMPYPIYTGCFHPLTSTHTYSSTNIDKTPIEEKKLSLVQKFKQMFRDYWYVLVPVHLVTSAFWFGGFYYLAQSNVDIIAILEKLNVSESWVDQIRSGHTTKGYLAIAYILYKVATPLRYTVTIGGTTVSIKYLNAKGWIKPIPPHDELKKLYDEKKESLKERQLEFKESMMNRYKGLQTKEAPLKEQDKKLQERAKRLKEEQEAMRKKE